jgi:hypothetical protein
MDSDKDPLLSFHQGSFSALQHLLQLSYSDDVTQQQRAACDLARLVEGK